MRNIVLIAAVPLLLTACGADGAGNSSAANNTASGAIPDTVEVNGVTYVRADKAPTAPAPTPSATTSGGSSLFGSSSPSTGSPSTTSDSGSAAPPNSGSGSAVAADHGQ